MPPFNFMNQLETKTVDIDSIFQDSENARMHSEEQLQYIAASLERFAQQKPIVVSRDNVIIAGNGTHLAARDVLGWDKISIVVSELSVEEARAYGIADNQLATQSDWNLDTLSKHIKDMQEWNPMQNWSAIGFDKDIIQPFIEASETGNDSNALQDFLSGEGGTESKDDAPQMAKPIKVTDEQREIIDQAINITRLQEEDYRMSEGRVIELICADYLTGMAQIHEQQEEEA